jgi:hypothetical protein
MEQMLVLRIKKVGKIDDSNMPYSSLRKPHEIFLIAINMRILHDGECRIEKK